jgi:hypothetical protein
MDSPTIDAELEKRFKTFICKRKGIDPALCLINKPQEPAHTNEEDEDAKRKAEEAEQEAEQIRKAEEEAENHKRLDKEIESLMQDAEQLANDRIRKEKELSDTLKNIQSNMENIKNANDNLMLEIASSKRNIADKEKLLEQLRNSNDSLIKNNKQIDDEIIALKLKCEEDNKKCDKENTELESKMHFNEFVCKVESNLNHMQKLHNSFEEFNLNAINLIQLTNKDATIKDNEQEIANKNATITTLQQEIATKQATIDANATNCNHKLFEEQVKQLLTIQAKDATIQAKEATIQVKEREIATLTQQAGSNLFNTFQKSVILTLSQMYDASQLQLAVTTGSVNWFQYFKNNVLLKLKYEREIGLLSSQQQQCNTNHHSIFNANAINLILQQKNAYANYDLFKLHALNVLLQQQPVVPVLPVNNVNANYDLFQLHTIRQLEKEHQYYMQQALLFELFSNKSIDIIRNQALTKEYNTLIQNALDSNNHTLFNERALCLLKSLVTSSSTPTVTPDSDIKLGSIDWVSAF